MQPFRTLTGIAAPLPLINIDTDMIIPKQFLKTIKRTGLGRHLFNDMRYLADGTENPDFVLNQPDYRAAQILIAGANFGCGSSREHAPWALLDFGIRCIVAPSFADIFFNNCFKNGILPLVLPQERVDRLMAQAGQAILTVNLEKKTLADTDGVQISFTIDDFRRACLLNGWDDIGLTEQHATEISAFEDARRSAQPWL